MGLKWETLLIILILILQVINMGLEFNNLFGEARDEGRRDIIISIPGTAFKAQQPATQPVLYGTNDGKIQENGGGTILIFAPGIFEDGLTITSMKFLGTSGGEARSVVLIRNILPDDGAATIATTTADGTERAITNVDAATIDNERFSYYFKMTLGNGETLAGGFVRAKR